MVTTSTKAPRFAMLQNSFLTWLSDRREFGSCRLPSTTFSARLCDSLLMLATTTVNLLNPRGESSATKAVTVSELILLGSARYPLDAEYLDIASMAASWAVGDSTGSLHSLVGNACSPSLTCVRYIIAIALLLV